MFDIGGQEAVNDILFSCLLVLFLLCMMVMMVQRKKYLRCERWLREMSHNQEEESHRQFLKIKELGSELTYQNHEQLRLLREDLAATVTELQQELSELSADMVAEVLSLEEKMQEKEAVLSEVTGTSQQLSHEMASFQATTKAELATYSARSRNLTEQLDTVILKMEQIKSLKREVWQFERHLASENSFISENRQANVG